jgi:hypothetical protein
MKPDENSEGHLPAMAPPAAYRQSSTGPPEMLGTAPLIEAAWGEHR